MAIKGLTCAERDAILHGTGHFDGWEVVSSRTDISGEFGEPRIETTWEKGGRQVQDVRHPDPEGGPDRAACEHYLTEAGEQ